MHSNRMGTFVSSSEIDRFTLHQTLRGLMPEEVAATLMSHLPPAGWSDVALQSDIEKLETAVKHDIAQLAAATKHQIDELRTATKNDLAHLAVATKHEFDDLRVATKVQFDQLGAATKHEIGDLRVANKNDLAQLETAVKHDIDDLRIRVDRLEVKVDKLASMKRYVVTTGIALAALITGFGVPAIVLGVQILAALN